MATRLFTYGKINRYATIPGSNHLPGTYWNAYGVQYGASAFNATANNMEPGEPVEIVLSSDKGYSVKRLTTSATASSIGILVRDVLGVRTQEAGVFKEYVPGMPMTIVPASAPQGWSIVVPLASSQTPAVGGQVYVGTASTANTTAGAIYTTNVNSECVTLTGWTFGSLKFTPTSDASLAVVIQKI